MSGIPHDKEWDFRQRLRDACINDDLTIWDRAEQEFGVATPEFINAAEIPRRCVNYTATKILSRCVERGADLAQTDAAGYTPIHAAAANDNPTMVQALLDRGVPVDVRPDVIANSFNLGGCTPLHVAAYERSGKCFAMLLERGANVNALEIDGQTPLERAFRGGLDDGVLLALIRHGVDDAEIARLWRKHWPQEQPLTAFQVAVRFGLADTTHHYLSERGEDPNQCTARGTSLLRLASRADKPAREALRRVILAHRSSNLVVDAISGHNQSVRNAKSVAPAL